MKWIEINIYDEDMNVPDMDEKVLCYHRINDEMFFGIARYTGFHKEYKFHKFWISNDLDYLAKPTHWCRLEKPGLTEIKRRREELSDPRYEDFMTWEDHGV